MPAPRLKHAGTSFAGMTQQEETTPRPIGVARIIAPKSPLSEEEPHRRSPLVIEERNSCCLGRDLTIQYMATHSVHLCIQLDETIRELFA